MARPVGAASGGRRGRSINARTRRREGQTKELEYGNQESRNGVFNHGWTRFLLRRSVANPSPRLWTAVNAMQYTVLRIRTRSAFFFPIWKEKWCERRESNPDRWLRRPQHYPLCYARKREAGTFRDLRVDLKKNAWSLLRIGTERNFYRRERPPAPRLPPSRCYGAASRRGKRKTEGAGDFLGNRLGSIGSTSERNHLGPRRGRRGSIFWCSFAFFVAIRRFPFSRRARNSANAEAVTSQKLHPLFQKLDVRGQRPDVRGQRSETGGQRLEPRTRN